MRYFLIVLVNVFVYYILRIATVFISFGFGIGASASSSKYIIPLSLFDLLLQILFVIAIGLNKKWNFNNKHLVVAIVVIFFMGILSSLEIIP